MLGFAQVTVVAVIAGVQGADRHWRAFQLRQPRCKSAGEMVSPSNDSDQHEIFRAVISFDDLVCDAREATPDLVGVHHRRLQASLLNRAHESKRSNNAIRM